MEYDELAQHLESLQREDCYRVDAVLKRSEHELTQRVYFVGGNGAETGPYIRKFIRQDPGMGVAYERIFAAQREGRRFKYVPDILECYARNGFLVVVMEYVRGETLQDVVYRLDPSPALAADIFPRLCDAVCELHGEFDPPIIHRDLKPSNIILSQAGLAIIDFGIAREFKEESPDDTTHFGTRGFAPPEQFGFGQTTVRSDIYSLGMVLYFLLTEAMPDSAIRDGGFADPRVPENLRKVIAKAAAFDPDARYASAQELRAAFCAALTEKVASGENDATPPQSTTPSEPDAPERPKPDAPADEKMPFRVLGEAWNVLLAILVAALFFKCGTTAAHPTGAAADNPRLYNFLVQYLCLWPSATAFAFAIADKRRLKQRFPQLTRFRWWQWLAMSAALMFALAFVAILLAKPFGAVAIT